MTHEKLCTLASCEVAIAQALQKNNISNPLHEALNTYRALSLLKEEDTCLVVDHTSSLPELLHRAGARWIAYMQQKEAKTDEFKGTQAQVEAILDQATHIREYLQRELSMSIERMDEQPLAMLVKLLQLGTGKVSEIVELHALFTVLADEIACKVLSVLVVQGGTLDTLHREMKRKYSYSYEDQQILASTLQQLISIDLVRKNSATGKYQINPTGMTSVLQVIQDLRT